MNAPATDPLPPCLIHIDKEGRWYHKGAEMIHREFIRLFYRNMTLDPHGRYVIHWKGERCEVEVEDTAYVVWRAIYQERSGGSAFILTLSDDSQEALVPDTLYVGEANVLYCRVRKGAFPARFTRPAYYQLTPHVEEEQGVFYLPLGGEKHPIRM
jgi:hypothetical protein